ncbi:endonuclease/exonuclease/phosphatase family protein [Brevibacterium otitidis]|uniref:Endonuclease/exonuclease/phosphatase family protein n=1 Tax=Brevibacterium otitidis TaxID=53364 RepID=A0ABV5X3A0_9MICO|nr:endonuclease/exonuclease/phosphatase family protein [Brevibacterium otitidis]
MPKRQSSPGKGILVFVAGLLLAALLAMHTLIPTTRGVALIVESLLPWAWILLVLLLLAALIRFSVFAIIGVLVPALVWGGMFYPFLRPADTPDDADIVVASQNVGARMPQPTATAQNLINHDPDVVAIQEIASLSGQIIKKQLDSAYEHTAVTDTVGIWSRWPLSSPEEIDLGLQWPRAIATTMQTDDGPVRVYAVHMPSVRPGQESLRNSALSELADRIRADDAERIIVAGDFNSAASDRYFSSLSSELTDSREAVGGGFGFTWPSVFPVVRLDHVLVRGFDPVGDRVLDRGTSDHRAIISYLDTAAA